VDIGTNYGRKTPKMTLFFRSINLCDVVYPEALLPFIHLRQKDLQSKTEIERESPEAAVRMGLGSTRRVPYVFIQALCLLKWTGSTEHIRAIWMKESSLGRIVGSPRFVRQEPRDCCSNLTQRALDIPPHTVQENTSKISIQAKHTQSRAQRAQRGGGGYHRMLNLSNALSSLPASSRRPQTFHIFIASSR
jgi:hypothetical protein